MIQPRLRVPPPPLSVGPRATGGLDEPLRLACAARSVDGFASHAKAFKVV